MTQIVGFVGKKQSGKDTSCNFLMMLHLCSLGICKRARLNEEGKVEVSDILGESVSGQEWLALSDPSVNLDLLLNNLGVVKKYSLADPLKEIAVNVFGLDVDTIFGDDEQKNEKIPLKWENMPGIITKDKCQEHMNDYGVGTGHSVKDYRNHLKEDFGLILHGKGRMTGREFLQYFGTEICRHIDYNVWAKCLLRRVEQEAFDMALISDVRFDTEIKKIKRNGGILLGLTRNYNSPDQHASEQANLDLCDAVIDNASMTILEQGHAIYEALVKLDCKALPKKELQYASTH